MTTTASSPATTLAPRTMAGPAGPFRVLAVDGISERGLWVLRQAAGIELFVQETISPEQLLAVVGEFDALIVRSATKVTAEVLARGAPRLKLVGRAGIGVDNIDVTAATQRGVLVMNTPTASAVTTAEHAIALLCALARHIPQAAASTKAGKWEKRRFEGRELCDKYLGVIGLGNVGRIVADRARGLHMRVLGYDPFLSAEAAAQLGVEHATLDDLLARADFITIHTPLTDETRNLLDARAFRKVKKGLLLVNAARGGVVDEQALASAIEQGIVAGAALDVFAEEPPPKDHPLLGLDSVICTPHLGASTAEAQEKVAVEIAEQLLAYVTQGEVKNAVNSPAIGREVASRVTPYLELAQKLGSLIGQLSIDAPPGEIVVELVGEPADLAPVPVVDSAVAGVLGPVMDTPVNRVSARPFAAEQGITVTELKRSRSPLAGGGWGGELANAVAVTAFGKNGSRHHVAGTVLSVGRGEPRIVRFDDFLLEVVPEGPLLIIKNRDVPGVIGAAGRLLGQLEVNISRMQVGLRGGEALSMWNISRPLGPGPLGELRSLPHLVAVHQVML